MAAESAYTPPAPDDMAARLELRSDQQARPSNVVPVLARLLRKLRDRDRQAEGQSK